LTHPPKSDIREIDTGELRVDLGRAGAGISGFGKVRLDIALQQECDC
jgi:hypothetical protein